MNAQLTEMSEQLRANSKRAEDIVAKAGIDRIAVRPRENAWSIAECLVHLTFGTMSYFPLWPDSLRQAGPQQGRYRMDFIGRMLAWVLEPPARFRAKSPANFRISCWQSLPAPTVWRSIELKSCRRPTRGFDTASGPVSGSRQRMSAGISGKLNAFCLSPDSIRGQG
jgi:hypothetical protein